MMVLSAKITSILLSLAKGERLLTGVLLIFSCFRLVISCKGLRSLM